LDYEHEKQHIQEIHEGGELRFFIAPINENKSGEIYNSTSGEKDSFCQTWRFNISRMPRKKKCSINGAGNLLLNF